MDKPMIETFLHVVGEGSFSQAAQRLFVSQSTVSSRLSQLEREVGYPLLTRGPGVRTIELTEKGRSFVRIAERWMDLYRESERLARNDLRPKYGIVAPGSFAELILTPICARLAQSGDCPRLSLRTGKSSQITGLIESGEADIGFAFFRPRQSRGGLRFQPILSEKMFIACNRDSPVGDPAAVASLEPDKEIYSLWSEEMTHWHDNTWGADRPPLVETDVLGYREALLAGSDCWSFCPASVAGRYRQNPLIRVCRPDFALPDRVCYLVARDISNPGYRQVVDGFRDQFARFRKTQDLAPV